MMLEERRRNEALRRAIDRFVRDNLSGWATSLLTSHEGAIADYFLQRWGHPSNLLLYLSPLININSQPGTSQEKYRFKVEFSGIEPLRRHSVSRTPASDFEVFNDSFDSFSATLRWSIPFPLMTPFDAYYAYLDVVGEMFAACVESAALRTQFSAVTKRQLVDLVEYMSTIAAWLRMDYYAGFSGTEPFRESEAMAYRQGVIAKISELVHKKIEPLAEGLQEAGVLDPNALILVWGESPAINQRLASRFIEPELGGFAGYFTRLAYDLSKIRPAALSYRRRDRIAVHQIWADFEKEKDAFRTHLLARISESLPEDVRKEEAAKEFFLGVPQTGVVKLER